MTANQPEDRWAPLKRWASALASLSGWRRHLCSFMAGAVATLALPPLFALPALVVALCVLLWLWDGAAKPWTAARLGWSFGFGYFSFGLYWIGFAFLVEAERFALLMPVAVLAMAGGLALFPALVLAAVQGLALNGAARLFAFVLAWLVSEWLRAWIFTGFPWNQLGSVWAFSPATLQAASLGGVWLLTALALLVGGAPSLLADRAARQGSHGDAVGGRRSRTAGLALVLGLSLALPLLSAGWGTWRLAEAPAPEDHEVEGVRLRLVQPAIPQALKWRSEFRRQHVVTQMQLSTQAEATPPSHIIWAETAVPYLMSGEPELARAIARVVPPGGALITGAPRSAVVGHQKHSWNSLHGLDPAGRITATYDKNHLVPFGEYVPFNEWLTWAQLVPGSQGFTPGRQRRNFSVAGLPPASPLICYEAIFPGEVLTDDATRPAWLLNVTNDAWFGISSGPHQHFAAARLRAVEEGLPLVRVANTGISATIDAYGRILVRLDLGVAGAIDSPLPRPAPELTTFARFGNWVILPIAALLVLLAYLARRFAPA